MTADAPRRGRAVLESFDRVIRLEAHNLSRWPELLWQQTYNELQWAGGDEQQLLSSELAKRTGKGSRPWLRRRTRLRQTSELVQIVKGHESRIDDCEIAPDRSWIASASYDATVKIWNVQTGRELNTLRHNGPVTACAVLPDGSHLLTASGDTVRLWDPRTGAEVRQLEPYDEGSIFSLALSSDGAVAVGVVARHEDLNNSGLTVWDVASGRAVRTVQGKGGIQACAVAPDGSFVVSAGGAAKSQYARQGPVIWDLRKGTLREKPKGHRGRVFGCAVAPDGSFIVSAGEDGTVRMWDPKGRELRMVGGPPRDPKDVYRDQERIVQWCAVSPDRSWIAAAYQDGTVKLWDPETGEELRTLLGHEDQVMDGAVATDGSFLVTGDARGVLRIWSLDAAGEVHDEDEGHRLWVNDCAFAPDGSFIVSASDDMTLKVWDPDAGRVLQTLEGHQSPIRVCTVFPEGSVIVSAGDDGAIGLWGFPSGKLLRVMRPPVLDPDPLGASVRVNACAVSPDTAFVVSAQGFALSVWDPRQGVELVSFERTYGLGSKSQINDCAVSPNASYVVSATGEELWLWDPATGTEIRRLGDRGAGTCAVAPDGSFVVSDGDIWDPNSGEHVLRLEDPSAPCAVTPDAAYAISGGATVRICEARSGRLVGMIPLLGGIAAVDAHPSKPLIVCGDSTGNVNLIEMMNVDLGPLIVTAFRVEDTKLGFRCPSCLARFNFEGTRRLGQHLDCPECNRALRLNPFVLDRPNKPSSAPAT